MLDRAALDEQATLARRAGAFRAAARHSGRVRLLRRFIVLGAVGSVAAILAFSILDPFRALSSGVSINRIGLDGTRVTMELPRMAGFQKDGRAYTMKAASGVQDLKRPGVIELTDIEARFALADKSNAEVRAPKGIYDTIAETMDLSGAITVRSDSGYDMALRSARMEFKTSHVRTNDPVDVVMKTGTVKADTMEISENGHKITFEGHVESMMLPATGEADARKSLKGTTP